MRPFFVRDPFEVPADARASCKAVDRAAAKVRGTPAEHIGDTPWMDAALLQAAGVETVVCGPAGAGAHADVEWVDVESVISWRKSWPKPRSITVPDRKLLRAAGACCPSPCPWHGAAGIHWNFDGGSLERVEHAAPDHFRVFVKGQTDQDAATARRAGITSASMAHTGAC